MLSLRCGSISLIKNWHGLIMLDIRKEWVVFMNWIWTPDWRFADNEEAQFVCFRKVIEVNSAIHGCNIKISADSRYKLYVNNCFVQEGPAKGGRNTWYFDYADIGAYMKRGKNVLAVIVLRYPEASNKRNASLHRTPYPCLFIEGGMELAGGERIEVSGESGWKCFHDRNIQIVSKEIMPAPLHILEEAAGNPLLYGWMQESYSDEAWEDAKPYGITEFIQGYTEGPFAMEERKIPYQRHTPGRFKNVLCIRHKEPDARNDRDVQEEWNRMLAGEGCVEIPAGQKLSVEIDAGEEMTGFLKLHLLKGAGAKITLKCAECYGCFSEGSSSNPDIPLKRDRTDFKNGTLFGYEDVYLCAGSGSPENPEVYEPFWFRTFRFLGVTVETGNEPLLIEALDYTETGYPLEIKTKIETSDCSLRDIWDISARTLQRCMHETYMDCPFFEQLQYIMDSRSQILYTYMTAADDRLARQCMDDLRKSQRPDGLLNSCAPSCTNSVIPGFSIYYILMVYDHMMYFGDQDLVRLHMPAVEGILNCFGRNLAENGLIKAIGGPLMRSRYWAFIDWAEDWDTGVPPAIGKGYLTMDSLLYLYGLMHAASLLEYIGRFEDAKICLRRAEAVRQSVRKNCIGREGLLMDGPGSREYSVHCQIFAVLTDTVNETEGKRLLQLTLHQPEAAQCSVAMSFYLFRALQKTGWYEATNQVWETWREMIRRNMTTCVESETEPRSDCHAWGAVALYELPAAILGVQPAEPGFQKIAVRPVSGYLDYARGQVATPKGMVYVEWEKKEDGNLDVRYKVPQGVEVVSMKKKQIYNPFLPLNEYIPDGEPHVFGDRVYLFGSHDKEGGDAYCMLDYAGYSAPVTDLTDWKYEGMIYKAEQDPYYSEERKYIYAPDAVQGNDGRYYLYYCLVGGEDCISVAVCDTPMGKYEYYGHVRNADGSIFKRFVPGDPAVINDDGVIRLYFGWSLAVPEEMLEAQIAESRENRIDFEEKMIQAQMMLFKKSREEIVNEPEGVMGANAVELAEDMVTIASEPVRIVPGQFAAKGTSFEGHAFYEGSSIRKIRGVYYFIYSSQWNHELCYATSTFPDRDFVYGGTIISNGDIGYQGRKPEARLNTTGTNHGSIECINGQWYVFYHRGTHATDYSRQACAEPIHILPDGKIMQVEITSCGLNYGPLLAAGEYPAAIACNITNGRMPHIQFDKISEGIPNVTHVRDERYITGIQDGTSIGFKYFRFEGPMILTVKVRGKGTGKFNVSDGTEILAEIPILPAKEWKERSAAIEAQGTGALYFTYEGSGEIEFLSFRFDNSSLK